MMVVRQTPTSLHPCGGAMTIAMTIAVVYILLWVLIALPQPMAVAMVQYSSAMSFQSSAKAVAWQVAVPLRCHESPWHGRGGVLSLPWEIHNMVHPWFSSVVGGRQEQPTTPWELLGAGRNLRWEGSAMIDDELGPNVRRAQARSFCFHRAVDAASRLIVRVAADCLNAPGMGTNVHGPVVQ